MSNDFEPTKYDKDIFDIETVDLEDVDIKAERMINYAAFQMIRVFDDPNIDAARAKYCGIVMYMESIARADKKWKDTHTQEIRKLIADEKLGNSAMDLFKVANKKYEIIMNLYLSNKPIKKSLSSGSNNPILELDIK